MEIVAIGSPSGCTPSRGSPAARRGLHVLSEKPLDITTERADELIDACAGRRRQAGRVLPGSPAAGHREIKRMLDDGELGKPVMIAGRVRWWIGRPSTTGSKWRGTWALDGGGALMNQAIHTVDLVQWMFGPSRECRRPSPRACTTSRSRTPPRR